MTAIVAQVREGQSDAFGLAGMMPWTRRERRLGDLDLMNQMLAVLEIQAHLDVLVEMCVLKHVKDDAIDRFFPA